LLVTTAIVNVGFNMAWAVLLVLAVRELGIAAAVARLVLSAGEVGGLVGAFLTARLTRTLGVGPMIVGSAALFAPSLLLLAVAPASAPIPFLVFGWSIASFASVLYNTTTVSVRQAYVPERLQARVAGFNRTIVWGVSPFGAPARRGACDGRRPPARDRRRSSRVARRSGSRAAVASPSAARPTCVSRGAALPRVPDTHPGGPVAQLAPRGYIARSVLGRGL
jgi:hypothetical protein